MSDDWWEAMRCWNGLSPDQQEFLRTEGYLPFGFRYEGDCNNMAEIGIETIDDEYPAPRFYCQLCDRLPGAAHPE